jgi:hypothetical protein
MNQTSLDRRDDARARQLAAFDRWKVRSDPEYLSAIAGVRRDLEDILRAAEGGEDADVAIAWRYLGDALLDLGSVEDEQEQRRMLAASEESYRRAFDVFERHPHPIEQAKLAYNVSELKHALSKGTDTTLLAEALALSEQALAAIRNLQPELVPRFEARWALLRSAVNEANFIAWRTGAMQQARESITALKQAVSSGDREAMANVRVDIPSEESLVKGFLANVVDSDAAMRQAEQVLGPQGAEQRELAATSLAITVANLRDRAASDELDRQARLDREAAADETKVHDARIRSLARVLHTEVERAVRPRDVHATDELVRHCLTLDTSLRDRSSPPGKPGIPVELLELASTVQRHARRYNASVALPFWASPPASPIPGHVFFAGSPGTRQRLAGLCAGQGLTLYALQQGEVAAQWRWEQLRRSAVGLFELGEPVPADGPVGASALELCRRYYEYGLALGLGVPAVVLSSSPLPFDLDDEPVPVAMTEPTDQELEEALERALFQPGHFAEEDGLQETARWLAHLVRGVRKSATTDAQVNMVREYGNDATTFISLLESAIASLPGRRPIMIFPRFPARHPDGKAARCFHVFRYNQPWSNATSEVVATACQATGAEYVRADQTADPRGVQSIWAEIGRATAVLVDVTACGPNVAFELGVAHALGKATALVHQGELRVIPGLERVKSQGYTMDDLGRTLLLSLTKLLAAPV